MGIDPVQIGGFTNRARRAGPGSDSRFGLRKVEDDPPSRSVNRSGEVADLGLGHSERQDLYSNTSILPWCVDKALTEITGKEALGQEFLQYA